MGRILVVDDDPFIVQELVECLTEEGLDCVSCIDPNEAIRLFHSDPSIDIVISDYSMPHMTGVELIEVLTRSKTKERIFGSILFSAVSERSDVLKAMRAGVFDYFTKPLELDLLLDGIQRLDKELEEKRAQQSVSRVFAGISSMNELLSELNSGVTKVFVAPSKDEEPKQPAAPEVDFSGLTPRQVEVAKCIGKGLTNYQTACELGISENTVKLYVSQVLKATGMSSRTKLAIAMRDAGQA